MRLWRTLTGKEETDCRQWARDNYQPCSDIKGTWHPVTQEECVQINREWSEKN